MTEIFASYFDQRDRQKAARVGTGLSIMDTDPETLAKSLALGRELGLPSGVVQAAPDIFAKQAEQRRNTTALSSAPRLTDWLRDPTNAGLAKDDVENLTWWEKNAGAFGRATGRGFRRLTAAPSVFEAGINVDLAADAGKTYEEILAEETDRLGIDQNSPAYGDAMRKARLRFDALQGETSPERFLRQGAEALAVADEIIRRTQSIPMSDPAMTFRDGALANAENSVTGVFGAFAEDPVGGAAFIAETAAEFLPVLAASTATTAITRTPSAGIAVMTGGSFLTENTAEAVTFLQESGVDMSTPEAALEVLQNEALMEEARQRGLTRGLVIALFDAASGGVAGQTLIKNPGGDIVAQGIAQVLFGSGGEAAAQFAVGDELDVKEVVIEGLAELVTTPIEVAGVARDSLSNRRGGGTPPGLTVDVERAAAAGVTASRLDEIDAMAAESKVRQRSQDKFLEAMDAVGLNEQTVFVPADAVREMFQGEVTDQDLESIGVTREEFDTQEPIGGDIAIPLSYYAANISGTDRAQIVRQYGTMNEGEMSIAEAQAFREGIGSAMQEAVRRAEQDITRTAEQTQADQEIYDGMFTQLRDAGRTPAVAEQEARVWTAFWRTMGERYGSDPRELASRFGVEVRGPGAVATDTAAARAVPDTPSISEPVPSPTPDVAITATGREIPVRYRVVDAADLVTSQTDDGRTNPAFPAELQPRDRTRGTSEEQIRRIATSLDPRLLGPMPSAADGAPIIGPDGVVESGNGRVLAIRRAYADQGERAAAYRDYIASLGYDVEGVAQPVLVRERAVDLGPEDRRAFTREANERSSMELSDTERAMADAASLPDSALALYTGGDVNLAQNRDFVRAFISAVVAQGDQGSFIDAEGRMSQRAVRRVQAALLAKAYGDASLVESVMEVTDGNIRAIGGALMDVAPVWAQMRREAENGTIAAEMDQTPALLEAVNTVRRARDEGRPVSEFVDQTDMFTGEAMDPMAEGFLRLLFRDPETLKRPAGRVKVADALTFYTEEARKTSPGADLLGETADPAAIIQAAKERQYEDPDAQAKLFTQPALSVSNSDSTTGGDGGRRAGDGAEGTDGAAVDRGSEGPAAGSAEELKALVDSGAEPRDIRNHPLIIAAEAEMLRQPHTFTEEQMDGEGRFALLGNRTYVDQKTGRRFRGLYELMPELDRISASFAGDVRSERKAVILIGPPAAGKSTIAERMIAPQMGARIVDSDEVKKLIPEYNDGIGAAAVHEESSAINKDHLAIVVARGDNLVLPKVGDNPTKMENEVRKLKAAGYSVDLVLMDVEPKEAFARMIGRFIGTGRLVNPDIAIAAGEKPPSTYRALREKGVADGYTQIDNNVGLEEDPIIVEARGSLSQSLFGLGTEQRGAGSPSGEMGAGQRASSEGRTLFQDVQPQGEVDLPKFGPDGPYGDTWDIFRRYGFDLSGKTDADVAAFIMGFRNGQERAQQYIEARERLYERVRQAEEAKKAKRPMQRMQRPDSEAFKKWFGESKMVDEDGRPIVFLHGTYTDTDFESFDLTFAGTRKESDTGFLGRGLYFSQKPDEASQYSAEIWLNDPRYAERFPEGRRSPRHIPVYLKIENPFVISADLSDSIGVAYGVHGKVGDKAMREILGGKTLKEWENIVYDPGGLDKYGEENGGIRMSEESFAAIQQFRDGFSEYLKREGYDGIYANGGKEVVVFDPTQVKSVFNRGTFDPNDPRILAQGQNTPRASIELPAGGLEGGKTVINLFENADLSSFLHEAGHFFLEAFSVLANDTAAPQQMKDDLATIYRYLEAEPGKPFETKHHEKFARTAEAYFLEGKAPSLELADVFARLKSWLVRIYKSVRGLNVEMDDRIRNVFDRMLATDEEIAAMRDVLEMGPLFSEPPAGMTDRDWTVYQRMARRGQEQAEQRLLAKTMERIAREKKSWFKEEKKATREEVAKRINAKPEYRLIEMLANQRWLGNEGADIPDMRIDKDMLVEQFGEDILEQVDRTKIGGKRAIYGTDGASPQEVAEFFGFSDAGAMADALAAAGKRQQVIDAEVEKVMLERYGDPFEDGTIEEEALAAIHAEQEMSSVVLEARHLARQLGRDTRGMTAKLYRQRARMMLGGMRVAQASRPGQFLQAERRASKAAQTAFAKVNRGGGQSALAEAFQAKEQQLLNQYLYDESRKIQEEVRKGRERMMRYNRKSVRQNLEGGYIEQIDALLAQYDFRVRSNAQVQRAESLKEFVERMEAEGRADQIAIDPRLIEQSKKTAFSRLTVDELRGLFDTIDNLDHLGRMKQKLIDAQERRDLNVIVQKFEEAFRENVKGKAPNRTRLNTEQRAETRRKFLNTTLNADTLLREVDGFKDLGPVWKALKQKIDEGMNRVVERRVQMAKAFQDIYGVYSLKEKRQMSVKKHNAALGGLFSKWDLIALALNTGNEDNFQRLTNSAVEGSFTPAQIEMALSDLDARDWKVVQGIWNYHNSFWPEIAAKEKRQTGTTPEKVEAKLMVRTANQPADIAGGYYPIAYDDRLSGLTDDFQQKDIAESLLGGRFGKAQTRNGHTKARQNSSRQSVKLDIGLAHAHVDQVIYDLELGEAVANSWRILQDGRVKRLFYSNGKKADYDALETWLLDTAAGERVAADGFWRLMRHLRTGFTISRLALNVSTALIQPTGLAQSAVVIGKKPVAKGTAMYMRHPRRWVREIDEVSPFMRQRRKTFERDMYNVFGDLEDSPTSGAFQKFQRDYAMPASFFLMTMSQYYAVDMPTWVSAYQKEIEASGNESKARLYADEMVKRAQGSGLFQDRGMFERGTLGKGHRQHEAPRMLTALGSYMFAKFNVAYEDTKKTDFRSPTQVMNWSVNMALLFTLEAFLYAAVKGFLPGEDEDDPEDWALWLAKETGLTAMSTLPYLREVGGALDGFGGGGIYGATTEAIARPFIQAAQGEADKAFVRSLVDAGGMLLHLPSSQTNAAIGALLEDDLTLKRDVGPLQVLGLNREGGRSIADLLFEQ